MEPVSTTVIYSTLVYFIGYYIGSDFYNYYKFRESFNEIKNELDNIRRRLNE